MLAFLREATMRLRQPDHLPAWIAAWVIAMTLMGILVLLLTVLAMHFVTAARLRREDRWRGRWILQMLDPEGEGRSLSISSRQLFPFLVVWNHLQESLRGEYKLALSGLARRAGVPALIERVLRKGGTRDRIFAAMALGHMRETSSWKVLLLLARQNNPYTSLAAARALVRIDPQRGVEDLIKLLITREDWPLSSVYGIMQHAGPEVVTPHLIERILGVPGDPPLRALQFLPCVRTEASQVVVHMLLPMELKLEVMIALLKAVNDPDLALFVRSKLVHEDWRVVEAALGAIGRMGSREDAPMLIYLLDHTQWKVRYEAANTLVRLPGLKPIEIELQASRHPDPFARDMLRHALAERNML
jgi:HEAT repeat protein